MPVDDEKTLVNQPTVADLTQVICRQLEDIKRLENVLKHYDWIETAKQLPTEEDGDVFAYDVSNLFCCTVWKIVVDHAGQYPLWCRIRPLNRRKT